MGIYYWHEQEKQIKTACVLKASKISINANLT